MVNQQFGLERNVCDITGNTAIHHACMYTNNSISLNILQLLIDDKNGIFDLEKRNEELIDPLMMCIINQSIDLCRLLIEKNVVLTKKDIYSRQSIHIACQIGNYELVSLLLISSNIHLNALDDNNRNCLFYAIDYGDENIVNLLIEKNINIKIQDLVGDTPLHLAVQHQTNAYQLTNCLLQTQDGKDLINESAVDGMTPILLASNSKQAEVIYLLIKNGVDVKAVDHEYHTALHLACKSGCLKSVFYLIEFGGLNVNELDCYRQTPIFYAYVTNDYILVEYLISCGARIDVRDNQNYLPIHIGIILSKNDEDFNLSLIDLYKTKHENLLDDQNNESEMTPLIIACMQGKFNIVKHLILNYKINLMSKCSNGHTSLHYACLIKNSKSFQIIEFLMEHGCTYEKVDQPKGSFLYTIIQHGDRQAAMYFIDYWLKANPDINELHYGETILDLFYNRAHIHHHDIDIKHLRSLFEKGAYLYSSKSSAFSCSLINDCSQFYLILLEYNCSTIVTKGSFIFNLLNSISIYRDNILLLNKNDKEFISVCEYFLQVVQLVHYYYQIDQFYSIIDRDSFPQLVIGQPSEEVETLREQLDDLRSTPLKLAELARKLIHRNINIPTKNKFQQLGLTGHLVDFLVQSTF